VGIEIERKFLVNKSLFKSIKIDSSSKILQGYLYSDDYKTIRVRTKDEKGFITIKGKTIIASRPEFEYEIPYSEAIEILETLCDSTISKTRNYIKHNNHIWEVDVFDGQNSDLIMAEIELKNINEKIDLPKWIIEEVTYNNKYYNNYLSKVPFNTWGK